MNLDMVLNFMKLAFRSFLKYRTYAFISLIGLAAGITSSVILMLYAYQELTFDSTHENREKISLVYKERIMSAGNQLVYDTWVPLANTLKEEYPDVEEAGRLFVLSGNVNYKATKITEDVYFADPEIFSIFTLPLHEAVPVKIMQTPSNAILSKEEAVKIFGRENPIGETFSIMVSGVQQEFTVAGILRDIPINSSIQPNIIVPFSNALKIDWVAEANWSTSFLYTFIVTNPERTSHLESLFPSLIEKVFDVEAANTMKFRLLPLNRYHNHFSNSERVSYILLSLSLLIILVATFNYINLATIQSIERTREIGIKKVLGASMATLRFQHMAESFIMTGASFVLSIGFLQVFLPTINTFLEIDLHMANVFNPAFFSGLVVLFFFISLASGLYPAFNLTRIKTIETLKGKMHSSPVGAGIRKGLITAQFGFSTLLIFGAVVIYKQIDFMRSFDLGFHKENIVVIPTNIENMASPALAQTRLLALKNELLMHPGIHAISASSHVPSNESSSYTMVWPDGWTSETPFRIKRVIVDESYFKLFGIDILQGRDFTGGTTSLDSTVTNFAIINEAALKAFGWHDVEGKKLNNNAEVVGVVEDHYYDNVSKSIEPMLFLYRPQTRQSSSFVSIRLSSVSGELVNVLREKWKLLDESKPFDYFFVGESFDRLYASDDRSFKIISWFSLLAIIITCMGLFGLSSFSIAQRTKEIGIRKVLGASSRGILVLLNKEYITLMLISIAVALPLGHYLMKSWLSNYAVQTSVSTGLYVLVPLVSVFIGLVTTSAQIVKAVQANPVDSLRSE